MKVQRKTVRIVFGIVIVLAIAGGCMIVYKSRAEPKSVAVSEYVETASYTGRDCQAVKPRQVDEQYIDSLMSRMLEVYNEIRETDYQNWTDEEVAYTTQGKYTTAASWKEYLQEKYTEIERQNSRRDTGQMLLAEIASDSRLLGYDPDDYREAEEYAEKQLIFGNGFSDKEDLLQELKWSENEYQDRVEETAENILKLRYVVQAIAETEDLTPSEAELAEAEKEYGEEIESWKEMITLDRVRKFLYENNRIKG